MCTQNMFSTILTSPKQHQHFGLCYGEAEARTRSQDSPRGICGGPRGIGTGFSASTSVFLCQYHPTNAQYWSSSTCCCYQKDKRAKSGNLAKGNAISEIGEQWIEKKNFHLACKEFTAVLQRHFKMRVIQTTAVDTGGLTKLDKQCCHIGVYNKIFSAGCTLQDRFCTPSIGSYCSKCLILSVTTAMPLYLHTHR